MTHQIKLVAEQPVICNDCNRSFRRPGGLKWHKGLPERAKPTSEQRRAVQCEHCQQWMKSAGALLSTEECAIHQCDF